MNMLARLVSMFRRRAANDNCDWIAEFEEQLARDIEAGL